jgi:hypothetical protein
MRSVDLAIYADALAGEAAAIAARAERVRMRLREAVIERDARTGLPAETAARLQQLGLLVDRDERALRAELAGLEKDVAAIEELQAWVEARLSDLEAA